MLHAYLIRIFDPACEASLTLRLIMSTLVSSLQPSHPPQLLPPWFLPHVPEFMRRQVLWEVCVQVILLDYSDLLSARGPQETTTLDIPTVLIFVSFSLLTQTYLLSNLLFSEGNPHRLVPLNPSAERKPSWCFCSFKGKGDIWGWLDRCMFRVHSD